jgi:hypothetical protein
MDGYLKRFGLVIAVAIGFLVSPAAGQLPNQISKSPVATPTETTKSPNNTEAERLRNERRQQARSLLISLATEARSFRDQALRGRTLTRIADLLWAVDNEQSLELFRRAWEAAEIADRESKESLHLRSQILAVVVRRDGRLAEEFLQKMKGGQETASKSQNSTSSLWTLNEAAQHRLNLAGSLLRAGDIERALQFADPVLGRVTISTLDFLTDLRDKAPAEADKRYAALLAASSGSALADANTVCLLSSYLFAPKTYVVFNQQGAGDISYMQTPLPPPNVSPQLRLAFFQAAAAILSRPHPPPDQDQSTTGVAGKYMVLKRLMPIFDSAAPKEIAAAMHSQFETMSSLVNEELKQTEDESLKKGIGPEKSLADEQEPLLDQIEHAKTSDERDDLYFRLALLALSKDDRNARSYVSKIDESDFRQRAQAWIDWEMAIAAIKKNKIESALELVHVGELSHVQRVWVMTQSAKLLAKTDSTRALSLLEEATAEARRIEGSNADRPRSLLAIANTLQLIDVPRVWDAIFEAVKAANSAEGFTGDGGAIKTTMSSKSQILRKTESVADFDIRGIFGQIAKSDYDRAIPLAAGFQAEAARANATIAIARAVLNDPAPAVSTPPTAQKQAAP